MFQIRDGSYYFITDAFRPHDGTQSTPNCSHSDNIAALWSRVLDQTNLGP